MALMKAKDIPKDAVIMSETEAIDYVWKLVTDWDSFADTWALRYSPALLGGLSTLTGIMVNSFYRRKLKLGSYGYMSSLIPITLLPGTFTALFHNRWVTTEMLLMRKDICPLCFEVRSLGVQLGLGLVYPMVLGPWSAFMFASRYGTFRVPSLTSAPKETWRFFLQISKPFTSTIAYIGVAHAVLSSTITYFEMQNHFSIRRKLLEMEDKWEEDESILK